MAAPYRITLEINSVTPTLHGRLLAGPDNTHRFTGWTSLLAALDAAISPDHEDPRPENATGGRDVHMD